MGEVTKPIMLDDTGQSIVQRLKEVAEAIDGGKQLKERVDAIEADAVKHTEQTLTNAQQTQARTNINAADDKVVILDYANGHITDWNIKRASGVNKDGYTAVQVYGMAYNPNVHFILREGVETTIEITRRLPSTQGAELINLYAFKPASASQNVLHIKLTQAVIGCTVDAYEIKGTTDHSKLENLDYAHSGHTGFQPTLVAGEGISIAPDGKTISSPNINPEYRYPVVNRAVPLDRWQKGVIYRAGALRVRVASCEEIRQQMYETRFAPLAEDIIYFADKWVADNRVNFEVTTVNGNRYHAHLRYGSFRDGYMHLATDDPPTDEIVSMTIMVNSRTYPLPIVKYDGKNVVDVKLNNTLTASPNFRIVRDNYLEDDTFCVAVTSADASEIGSRIVRMFKYKTYKGKVYLKWIRAGSHASHVVRKYRYYAVRRGKTSVLFREVMKAGKRARQ